MASVEKFSVGDIAILTIVTGGTGLMMLLSQRASASREERDEKPAEEGGVAPTRREILQRQYRSKWGA